MTRITKAINPPLLEEQLATYTGLVYQIHRNPTPENSFFEWDDTLRTSQENSEITGIVNAHDHTQLSTQQQEAQAESLTRDDIRNYLRQQLTTASPANAATVAAQVQTFVGSNQSILNAISRIATLYGYDTGTNSGYLRAVYILVGIFS